MKKRATTALITSDKNIYLYHEEHTQLYLLTREEQNQYFSSSAFAKKALKNMTDIEKIKLPLDIKHAERNLPQIWNDSSLQESRAACLTLGTAYSMIQDEPVWATALVIGLLGRISNLVCPLLPGLPLIQLGAISADLDPLRVIMEIVNDTEQWKGSGWWLKQRWILSATTPLGTANPSHDPVDYVGGESKAILDSMLLPQFCSCAEPADRCAAGNYKSIPACNTILLLGKSKFWRTTST